MIRNFFTRLLDINQKEVERLSKIVDKINAFEPKIKKLKKEDFLKKTQEFKKRLKKGESLEAILPEAYALVREASYRILGMRHYDVQLMASVALFEGKVAEQKTGEGKTLSAVPALYLRAIAEKGAHLVTVNDYLARRDAGWNAPIFHLLGLSVASIIQENKSFIYDPNFEDKSHGDERLAHLKPISRKEAYEADITYGTNNEFGFDYLRDNMAPALEEVTQRGHYFAIVDEVDSVLIDEARTPLIISAPDSEPTNRYYQFASLIEKLVNEVHYKIDEKQKTATLTEDGIQKLEELLNVENLYEKDFEAIHHIENALKAKTLFLRDRDYIVRDGEVTIVDEFTGRLMYGRRWSDGLHQAVEAKERVVIKEESKTLATISFQNYFRMYEHLGGMTGTAATEAGEFKKIYKLEVVAIPTHKKMIRKDSSDEIYKTLNGKYNAIAKVIEEKYKKGQPVLVGTTSIEKNEIISEFLKKRKIPHNVLNAKNHENEALIIAQAGKVGAVTVATNMAGRGVDIILGGAPPDRPQAQSIEKFQLATPYKKWKKEHDKVVESGGLHVIGTERHESRRIDNQLRGRSGRQGDPGSSQFYLCLEDDLMRIFGGAQISSIMDRLKIPEDQPIKNVLISKAIESAQSKVEGMYFDTRKNTVDFDDVNNKQREIIYKLRRRILASEDLKEEVLKKLWNQIERILIYSLPEEKLSINNKKKKKFEVTSEESEKIIAGLIDIIPFDDKSKNSVNKKIKSIDSLQELREFLEKILKDSHSQREKQVGSKEMRQIEKYAYLNAIDHLWIDHLDRIDDLREGIYIRQIGQRDPLVEFKNEAFNLFETLIDRIDEEIAHRIYRISVVRDPYTEIPLDEAVTNIDKVDNTGLSNEIPEKKKVVKALKSKKIQRNDPCWCGSGKKWKKCHYPELSS